LDSICSCTGCSFITVYCVNFIIIWCAALHLFFSLAPLLARYPGDRDAMLRDYCLSTSSEVFLAVVCRRLTPAALSAPVDHLTFDTRIVSIIIAGMGMLTRHQPSRLRPRPMQQTSRPRLRHQPSRQCQDSTPNNTLNNTQFNHSVASTTQVHQHFKQGISHLFWQDLAS